MKRHIPLSENCPVIQVFKEKSALVLLDARLKPQWLMEPDEIPAHSWMGVPLLTGEEAIGVLSIERYETGAYCEKDTRVLQAFANHAAVAIRNAQLYQELMEAHKKLQEQNAQLTALNESKDKFFSIISHDLRSPFTVVLTFAELLVEELEERKEEHLKVMAQRFQRYAEKFYALLQNLLTWTQMQRGLMQCRPTKFDLWVAVENTIELFSQKAEEKGITLKSFVSEQTHVYADYGMVGTVLRNLISNALKFTDSGGEISISVRSLETFLEVTVSDTGCGIPKDSLAKLFRIDEKYVRDGIDGEKGTGFGLILSQDLVEQNGGRIWVKSEEGKGSAFMFTLPISSPINHS
jgi:signal transduction histidine kinase